MAALTDSASDSSTMERVAPWMKPFLDNGQHAVVLDGATGTTLVDRGADVSSMFWSGQMFMDEDSPCTKEDLYKVHLEFLEAGADVLTANCYKLSDEILTHIPKELNINITEAHDLILQAVSLACRARDEFQKTLDANAPRRLVSCGFGGFGAAIPQHVCAGLSHKGFANYPVTDEHLRKFWKGRLQSAIESEADMIGLETIPALQETKAICEVLNELKPTKPVWLAWSCQNGEQIGDGTLIKDAVEMTNSCSYVTTVGVNCSDSVYISSLIQIIANNTDKSIIVYPNFGRKWDARVGHRCWVGDKHQYHTEVNDWADLGCKFIGGCCECDPAYLVQIAQALKPGLLQEQAKIILVAEDQQGTNDVFCDTCVIL